MHFIEAGNKIKERITEGGWGTCEFMSGEVKRRQDMVDRFQAGETDVLVCTFGVGGQGITLTRARSLVLLDRPWTPGDVAQAEDRVRRIGQNREVHVYWMQATVMDKEIDKLVKAKNENSNAVMFGGSGSGGGGGEAGKTISIKELLSIKSIFTEPMPPPTFGSGGVGGDGGWEGEREGDGDGNDGDGNDLDGEGGFEKDS